jgi:hypothetical protein
MSAITKPNTSIFGIFVPGKETPDVLLIREALKAIDLGFSTESVPGSYMSMGVGRPSVGGTPTVVIGSKKPPV